MIKSLAIREKLFSATPIYSLVFARIAMGLVIFWECYNQLSKDLVRDYYLPPFLFKYYGFSWVAPLPNPWIYWFFCLLLALSVFVIIGIFYRTSLTLLLLGFTYVFLLDQTYYLNHYYMIILLGTLLLFMPANRYFSFDAYFNPQIKSEEMPFWPVLLLRLQLEIILLFAGFVKINYDWLERYMPLKMWLAEFKTYDWLHNILTQNWFVVSASYGVILLHLVGAPLLFFKQTRIYIFIVYCCFHLMNHFMFPIGSFPWMTMAMTLIFFDPDWPKKIFKFFDRSNFTTVFIATNNLKQNFIIAFVGIWVALQILVPLRYLLYPGYVSWTGEGFRFSWRMKLNENEGALQFYVTTPDSQTPERVAVADYISYDQFIAMLCRPDMILQFAHHIHKIWTEERGYSDVKVTVDSSCALNGRKLSVFVKPDIDLSKIKRDLKHAEWIAPFDVRSQ